MGSAGTLRQALERLALAGRSRRHSARCGSSTASRRRCFLPAPPNDSAARGGVRRVACPPGRRAERGIGLSIFSGSWKVHGLSGAGGRPDDSLIAAAIVTVIARAPQVRDRPPIQIGPIHSLAAATVGVHRGVRPGSRDLLRQAGAAAPHRPDRHRRLSAVHARPDDLRQGATPIDAARLPRGGGALSGRHVVLRGPGAHRARLSALYIGPSNRHPRRPRARAVPRGRRQWHGDLHRPRGRSRGRTNVAWALAAQCGERDRSPLRRLARVHAHPIGVGGFRCGDRGHDARSPTAQTMAAAGRRRRCPS